MHNCMKVRQVDVKNLVTFEIHPLRHKPHKTELIVAKNLNIDAAIYLYTKRQIFQGYVEHLKTNNQSNWNKTAALNVANLDVRGSLRILVCGIEVYNTLNRNLDLKLRFHIQDVCASAKKDCPGFRFSFGFNGLERSYRKCCNSRWIVPRFCAAFSAWTIRIMHRELERCCTHFAVF